MKFMLMMNAPRGNGDWAVTKWAPEDLQAHVGFMKRFNAELREEGAWVGGRRARTARAGAAGARR